MVNHTPLAEWLGSYIGFLEIGIVILIIVEIIKLFGSFGGGEKNDGNDSSESKATSGSDEKSPDPEPSGGEAHSAEPPESAQAQADPSQAAGEEAAAHVEEAETRKAAKNAMDMHKIVINVNNNADSTAQAIIASGNYEELLKLIKLDEEAEKAGANAESSVRDFVKRKRRTRRRSSRRRAGSSEPAADNAERETLEVLTEFENITAEKSRRKETVREMCTRFRKMIEHRRHVSKNVSEQEKKQIEYAKDIESEIQERSGESAIPLPPGQAEREDARLKNFSDEGLNTALIGHQNLLQVHRMLSEHTDLSNRFEIVISQMNLPPVAVSRVYLILAHLLELEKSGELKHLSEGLKEQAQKALMEGQRARHAALEEKSLLAEEFSNLEAIIKDSNHLVSLWKKMKGILDTHFAHNSSHAISPEMSAEITGIARTIIKILNDMQKTAAIMENVEGRYAKNVDPAIESFVQSTLDLAKFLSEKSLPEAKRAFALNAGRKTHHPGGDTYERYLTKEERAIIAEIEKSEETIKRLNHQILERDLKIKRMKNHAKRNEVIRGTRSLRRERASHHNRILELTARLSGVAP